MLRPLLPLFTTSSPRTVRSSILKVTLVPTAKYVSTVAVTSAPATTFAGDVVNVPLLTAIRRLANVSLLPMAKIWCGPLVVVTGIVRLAVAVPVPEARTSALLSGVNDVSRE